MHGENTDKWHEFKGRYSSEVGTVVSSVICNMDGRAVVKYSSEVGTLVSSVRWSLEQSRMVLFP